MKRFITAVLLTALLVSCGSGVADDPEAPGEESVSDTAAEERDNLPDADLEGYEFRIFNAPSVSWKTVLEVQTQTGEVLDDAIYTRNRHIEDRFNFNFKETVFNDQNAVKTNGQNSVLANDDAFDIALLIDRDALVFAQEGYICSMDALPYIDTSREHWSRTINADISIKNKLYFSYGDFNLTSYDYTFVMLFNKIMAEAANTGNLYDTVNDGAWTFDKFAELAVSVTADTDGDGVMTENDRYGLDCADKHVLPSFWIAAGVKIVNKNADDEPYFTAPSDEKFAEVYENIFNITKDNGIQTQIADTFKKGRSLFAISTAGWMFQHRDMEDDFGVLPIPKYTREQPYYNSRVGGGSVSVVPVTAARAEEISIIIESMAFESRKSVIPAYYEVALKSKYTRDVMSEEMLDLIYSRRTYDLGDTYWCNQLRDGVFAGMYTSNDRNLASKMSAIRASIDETISLAVAAFDKLE